MHQLQPHMTMRRALALWLRLVWHLTSFLSRQGCQVVFAPPRSLNPTTSDRPWSTSTPLAHSPTTQPSASPLVRMNDDAYPPQRHASPPLPRFLPCPFNTSPAHGLLSMDIIRRQRDSHLRYRVVLEGLPTGIG
ncbi:hypothetical protein B0H63DRAFT_163909 [Podospora didyma]|uniref:Secreted protein n=1 Tax=Podospora didyma TaxID=330526 RepID=A0AAE0NU36_9PEZI|nr:hypothetical protein B0H63DRAFT_163909 [Podospora didyma]